MKQHIFTIFLIASIFVVSCSVGGNKSEQVSSNNAAANSKVVENVDNSLQKVKSAGKLVLGLDDTFAPMGFKDENGDIVGFDIDLAREVAARMGVNLEPKHIAWETSSLSLTNGDVDVLWNGVNINEERKAYMNFSKPYLNNMLVIVKYVDNNAINSIDDLAGKVVGVQSGGNYEQIANNKFVSKIKELNQYGSNIDAFVDLQSHRLDAVIMDDVFAQYYIAEKKAPFVIVASTPLTDGVYAVGFRKSDVELLNEVNRILDEMKADGKAAEISQKWFGKDIILK